MEHKRGARSPDRANEGSGKEVEYTPNAQLKKPGYADTVDIQDLNDNFDVVDTHIGSDVASDSGAHGMRYNPQTKYFETYDGSTSTWARIVPDVDALPLTGGTVQGDFAVSDKFSVSDRVYVTRRLMGQEADFESEVNVGGSLTVGKTTFLRSGTTIGCVSTVDGVSNYTGELLVYGQTKILNDVTIGRKEADGTSKGRLDIVGSLSVGGQIDASGTINTHNLFPDTADTRSIGKQNLRYNTLYTKKVDASEKITVPKVTATKLEAPQATLETLMGAGGMLLFGAPDGCEVTASTAPLPVAWGGTGKNTALTASDVGALPLTGGTLTGNLRIYSGDNDNIHKINLGDGEFVYISEPEDDCMEIHATSGISVTGGQMSASAAPAKNQRCFRNIYTGDTAMSAKSTVLTSGTIYLQYE